MGRGNLGKGVKKEGRGKGAHGQRSKGGRKWEGGTRAKEQGVNYRSADCNASWKETSAFTRISSFSDWLPTCSSSTPLHIAPISHRHCE